MWQAFIGKAYGLPWFSFSPFWGSYKLGVRRVRQEYRYKAGCSSMRTSYWVQQKRQYQILNINARWNNRGGMDRFLNGLNLYTSRSWGIVPYNSGDGESARMISKIVYRSTKFLKVIQFLNPDIKALADTPDVPLEAGTQLWAIQIIEQ